MKKLALIFILICVCSSNTFARTHKATKTHTNNIVQIELFFGLALPTGGVVSAAEWATFQQQIISPVFAGFTVSDATGFYKGVAEPTKIVTLLIPTADIAKIKRVAQLYAQQFHQESVLLVQLPVTQQEFITANHH